MSEPVAFVSHFRVKDGAPAALEQLSRDVTQELEAEKPRTLVYLAFTDRSRARVTFLHVFADEESMDLHFEGAAERSRAAFELMVPDGWEVYGRPSDEAIETLRQAAAATGVSLTVQPVFMAGFLRATPAPA